MSSEKKTPVAVGVLSLLRPNLLTRDQELVQGNLALGKTEAHVPPKIRRGWCGGDPRGAPRSLAVALHEVFQLFHFVQPLKMVHFRA